MAPAGFDENGQMTLPVKNGRKGTVTVAPAETLRVLLKPGEKEDFEAVFQPALQLPGNRGLQAPLAKGEVVGYLVPAVKESARTKTRAYVYLTAAGREEERVPVLPPKPWPQPAGSPGCSAGSGLSSPTGGRGFSRQRRAQEPSCVYRQPPPDLRKRKPVPDKAGSTLTRSGS